VTTPEDPASAVVNTFITALRRAFNPGDVVLAPLGGGSTTVRFFVSDDARAYVDAGLGKNCREPFLWVRLADRYRSRLAEFPNPVRGNTSCKADIVNVATIEIGVARCTSKDGIVNFDKLEQESEITLSDSWRIEMALAEAARLLCSPDRAFTTDTVAIFGPEGGIVAVGAVAYVQLAKG
jgi:hypothetical protein